MKPTRKHIAIFALASMALGAGSLLVLFGPEGARAQDHAKGAKPPKLLEEFAISKQGEPIMVPVRIDGKDYSFLVDTSSTENVFDLSLEKYLGKPKRTYSIAAKDSPDGKAHKTSFYYAPDVKFGSISLQRGGEVLCRDLAEFRPVTGLDIRGVLGMGQLRRYAVQFAFDEGKLRFFESGDVPGTDWGQSVAMDLRSGIPSVTGTLFDKMGARFLIDSARAGTTGTLSAALFEKMQKEKWITRTAATRIAGLKGVQESMAGRIDLLKIGAQEYKGLVFEKGGKGLSMLSLGFLSRHTVTFDFPNLKLYLKKGRTFDTEDQFDMSGLHLLQRNGAIVVDSLDKDSPATFAGLEAKDILLKLDDTLVKDLSLVRIRNLLRSEDGKTIEVIFRRGKQAYRVPLQLKKKL